MKLRYTALIAAAVAMLVAGKPNVSNAEIDHNKIRYARIEELANAGDYVEADTMMENLKTVVNDRKLAEKCRRLDKIIDREELQIAKQLLAERRLVPAKQLSAWDKSNWNSLYQIWRNIKKDDNFEGKEEVYDELADLASHKPDNKIERFWHRAVSAFIRDCQLDVTNVFTTTSSRNSAFDGSGKTYGLAAAFQNRLDKVMLEANIGISLDNQDNLLRTEHRQISDQANGSLFQWGLGVGYFITDNMSLNFAASGKSTAIKGMSVTDYWSDSTRTKSSSRTESGMRIFYISTNWFSPRVESFKPKYSAYMGIGDITTTSKDNGAVDHSIIDLGAEASVVRGKYYLTCGLKLYNNEGYGNNAFSHPGISIGSLGAYVGGECLINKWVFGGEYYIGRLDSTDSQLSISAGYRFGSNYNEGHK